MPPLLLALLLGAVALTPATNAQPSLSVDVSPGFLDNGGTISVNFTCSMGSSSDRARLAGFSFLDSNGDDVVTPVYTIPTWSPSDSTAIVYWTVFDIELDAWGPSGTYQFTNLRCTDDLSRTATHPDIPYTITNNLVAITPTVNSITLSNTTSVDEDPINMRLNVSTNAPPAEWQLTIDRPGGGSLTDVALTETIWDELPPGSGYWIANHALALSQWLPSGIYTIRDLTATNSADLTSAPFSPNPTVDVQNSNSAYAPSVLFARMLNTDFGPGDFALLEINATSNAPIISLSVTLEDPDGTAIVSGPTPAPFSIAADQVWTRVHRVQIPDGSPDGVYSWTGLTLENEGELVSSPYQDVTFTIGGDDGGDSGSASGLSPLSSPASLALSVAAVVFAAAVTV